MLATSLNLGMHQCKVEGDGAYVKLCNQGLSDDEGISSLLEPPCKQMIVFQLRRVVGVLCICFSS